MSGIEIIGAVTASLQLIQQASKLGTLVKSIRDRVQDAPDEIAQRAGRLEGLEYIAKRIQKTEGLQTDEARKILIRCHEIVNSLRPRLLEIEFKAEDSRIKKTWRAICGQVEEDDIFKLFEALNQEENLLNLHISSLNTLVATNYAIAEAVHNGFSSLEAQLSSKLPADPEADANRLLKALFEMDPSSDRASLVTAKGGVLPGSCDWILTRSEFLKWESSDTGLLWISGGPGMGKTMMSIYLTQRFEENVSHGDPQSALTYFFCDIRNPKRNKALSIVRGLLFQLLQGNRHLIGHILPFYQLHGDNLFHESLLDTLWQILIGMANDAGFSRAICILDGLDECDEASLETLLPKLKETGKYASKLRIIIASREYPTSLEMSLGRFPRVRLDPESNKDISHGLERYISTRVDEIAEDGDYPPKLTEHIKKTLVDRSDGTYHWVSLVIANLQGKDALEAEEHLEKFPTHLNALYQRMLEQIDVGKRPLVCDILRWCAFAMRPLAPNELAVALDIRATRTIDRGEVQRRKLAYCGHLVSVSDTAVTFVHRTVYDFLTDHRKIPDRNAWYSLVYDRPQEAKLASTCLKHLEHGCFDKVPQVEEWPSEEKPEEHGFTMIPYALRYWDHHMRKASAYGDKLVDCHWSFFRENSPALDSFLRWRSHETLESFGTLQHVGAAFGINRLVEEPLHQQRRRIWHRLKILSLKPVVDSMGQTPLHRAAAAGHFSVVQLLIDHRADVNAQDSKGDTPLVHAVRERGDGLVIFMLLQAGADADGRRPGASYRKAVFDLDSEGGQGILNVALVCDAVSIVRAILDRYPRLSERRDLLRGSPLHNACYHGSLETTKMLLREEWGFDPSCRNDAGQTPLHFAAQGGRERLARLLLEDHGVEANQLDDEGRTPLWYALNDGSASVVKLLMGEWHVPIPKSRFDGALGPIHLAAGSHRDEEAAGKLQFLIGEMKLEAETKPREKVMIQSYPHKHEYS
ncbi:hypothetical protein ACJ41O_003546 [Fusarium nematophilum]